jgi:hypothetical protein
VIESETVRVASAKVRGRDMDQPIANISSSEKARHCNVDGNTAPR